MKSRLIINAKALVGTYPPGITTASGAEMATLPIIEHGWLLVRDGRIAGLGPMSSAPSITDGMDVIHPRQGSMSLSTMQD